MKNDNIVIEVGQTWADKQKGQEGRTVEITAVDVALETGEPVRVTAITRTPTKFSRSIDGGAHAVGRVGNISVKNLRKSYELVSTPEGEPSEDSRQHAAAAETLQTALVEHDLLRDLQTLVEAGDRRFSVAYTGRTWIASAAQMAPARPGERQAAQTWVKRGATLSEALEAVVKDTGW